MYSSEQLDQLYIKKYGLTRTQINEKFLNDIDKNSKILEVGCNVGNQLVLLKNMGYHDLWGVDISKHAINMAKQRLDSNNIFEGSALQLPFEDNQFDLVFTSGVLIHISPDNVNKALNEIYRCSKSNIWGFEYYSSEGYQSIIYRGNNNLLWKTDFSKLYLDQYPDLKLIHQKIIKYKENDELDMMFLLKKA